MPEDLLVYLSQKSLLEIARDGFDIFLVYYVFYRLLLVVRGTRAMQVAIGLGVVFLLYVVAQVLQLITILTILGSLLQSIILVIVVVFQSDIRRALQRVGSRAWFGSWARAQESMVIDEVVEAASELARHRIGAIITFEQDANLDEFVGVHKGHEIDAKVTRDLLVSLFIPESTNKLHDGAVIIRNLRIAKAGVFFPMPETRVDPSFGSRHRAALGITEETDAVVVVVSEERGTISCCFNGNIVSNLDGVNLRKTLARVFRTKVGKKAKKPVSQRRSEVPPEPKTHRPHEPRPRDSEERERLSLRTSETDMQRPTEIAIPARRSSVTSDSKPPPPLRKRPSGEVDESVPSSQAAPQSLRASKEPGLRKSQDRKSVEPLRKSSAGTRKALETKTAADSDAPQLIPPASDVERRSGEPRDDAQPDSEHTRGDRS